MFIRALVCAASAAVALSAPAAFGQTYGFFPVTANTVANTQAGQSQLSVTVNAGPNANQVSFTFNNAGPAAMSITDVYFDDGTLLGIALITSSSGVSFSQGASPGNLPSGNNANPAFDATAGFSADSNPPAQPNGVNPGESLTITFNLLSGVNFADTVAALNAGTNLRIGIHVQGFANGGSESFINQVPAPASLGTLLLGGLLAARRRR